MSDDTCERDIYSRSYSNPFCGPCLAQLSREEQFLLWLKKRDEDKLYRPDCEKEVFKDEKT